MPKVYDGDVTVYQAAKERFRSYLLNGDRLVCSISGGKDSTIIMELMIEVAREEGALPIEVVTRDEEIMYPGTFEYLERVAQRVNEVTMNWVIAGQAIINAYNRFSPYWWVFDPDEQDKWVREPPAWAVKIDTQVIEGMVSQERFPVSGSQRLIACTGLRANESLMRMNRIASTGGALTKHPTDYGAYTLAAIYDWLDEDVWRAIREKGWDYNTAYNALYRMGVPKNRLRIAPPSMRQGMATLGTAQKLWPTWFDKVERRLPGMRAAAYYGRRALMPYLQRGETWQDVMDRIREDAVTSAPWMVARIDKAVKSALSRHKSHSTAPYPQTEKMKCTQCPPHTPGSWEKLATSLYNGDPWCNYNQDLEPLDPRELNPAKRGWYEGKKRGRMTF